MKFTTAYIISWLGDKSFSKERIELLKEVASWCESKDLSVCIIAMQWEEDYYKYFSSVSWIKSDLQFPPGQARNIALNHFYSTDDDYCIILDDDTFIVRGDDIIDTARSKDIGDLISVVQEELLKIDYSDSKYHRFRYGSNAITGLFLVKNFRKWYKDEIFFNTNFVYEEGFGLVYGEDTNFCGRVIDKGYRSYQVYSSCVNGTREAHLLPSTWLNGRTWIDLIDEGHAKMHNLCKLDYKNTDFAECGAPYYVNKQTKSFKVLK